MPTWNNTFVDAMYYSGLPELSLTDEEWWDWDVMYLMGWGI